MLFVFCKREVLEKLQVIVEMVLMRLVFCWFGKKDMVVLMMVMFGLVDIRLYMNMVRYMIVVMQYLKVWFLENSVRMIMLVIQWVREWIILV